MTEVLAWFEIYQLADPHDGTIRYIGYSRDAQQRYRQHLSCKEGNYAKNTWIRELKAQGMKPVLSILGREEYEILARERETYWIYRYAKQGMPLFNWMKNPLRYGNDPFAHILSPRQREELARINEEGMRRFGTIWEKLCREAEDEYYTANTVEVAKIVLEFCELREMRRQK